MMVRRRRGDDESPDTVDRYVHSRKTDHDTFARGAEFLNHYKILTVPVAWFFAGLGFRIITPRATSDELTNKISVNTNALNVRVDSNNARIVRIEQTQAAMESTHDRMQNDLSLLVHNLCLSLTERDQYRLRITQRCKEDR